MSQTASPPNTSAGISTCVYLYCFSQPLDATFLDTPGIQSSRVFGNLVHEGVAAIHSIIEQSEIAPLLEGDQTLSADWVIRWALEHEKVIEKITANSPAMPVRFGSVFSNLEILGQHLSKYHSDITRFLENVTGKQEWILKANFDLDLAVCKLTSEDAVFSKRKESLTSSPGTRYLQEKKFWADVQQESKIRLGNLLDRIQASTMSMASDARFWVKGNPTSGNKTLVWQGSYLLSPTERPLFHNHVLLLREEISGTGLELDESGPCPLYSFCPSLG